MVHAKADVIKFFQNFNEMQKPQLYFHEQNEWPCEAAEAMKFGKIINLLEAGVDHICYAHAICGHEVGVLETFLRVKY